MFDECMFALREDLLVHVGLLLCFVCMFISCCLVQLFVSMDCCFFFLSVLFSVLHIFTIFAIVLIKCSVPVLVG